MMKIKSQKNYKMNKPMNKIKKLYSCKICNKYYYLEQMLKKHLQTRQHKDAEKYSQQTKIMAGV